MSALAIWHLSILIREVIGGRGCRERGSFNEWQVVGHRARQTRRFAIVESSLGRASGFVQGQVAMQIPQDAASAKYGMHLSKSTYQRSTPRTVCFSC